MSDQAIQHAMDVKRRYEAVLMRKANVVAVGVGFRTQGNQSTHQVSIIVSVKTKINVAELKREDVIPSSIENVPVDVVETGTIKAQ